MIARWKIKREVRRLFLKMNGLPERLTARKNKAAYEKRKSKTMVVHDGQPSLFDEYAVFLLYQPQGIAASTIEQIEIFSKSGVSTVVVSNAPLSDVDRKRLLSVSFKVIERENYGYDFGGYRDGILYLLNQDMEIDNLYVLNDSIWLLFGDDRNVIESSRRDISDIYGIFYNEHQRFSSKSHLQSYYYRFNKVVVNSAVFKRYWVKMIPYNNKDLVIRRHEMGLTNFFLQKGFSIGAMQDSSKVLDAVSKLPPHLVNQFIEYCIQVNTKAQQDLRGLVGLDFNNPDNFQAFICCIKKWRIHCYSLNTHPSVLIRGLLSPVLKKDKQFIYQLQRLELIKGCAMDVNSTTVLMEIDEAKLNV